MALSSLHHHNHVIIHTTVSSIPWQLSSLHRQPPRRHPPRHHPHQVCKTPFVREQYDKDAPWHNHHHLKDIDKEV
jgi:hypothetical protein